MLSQVDHILSLCTKEGMSSDIFHKELGKIVILSTHAAWQATHAVHKAFFDSQELLLDNSSAHQLVEDCQSWGVSQS